MNPSILDAPAHSASFATVTRHAPDDADVVDFCIPCNPYFPTPAMFAELSAGLPELVKYYPSDSAATAKKLAAVLGLNPQVVAMANGSTELLTWIDHLLVHESLAVPIPTFGRWTDQPLETGKRVDMFRLREEDGFALDADEYVAFLREHGSRVAVICNPNNPDGGYVPRERIVRFLDEVRDLDLVVIDESFAATIGRALPKWNLNALAETVVHMIEDHWEAYGHSLELLARDREHMLAELSRIPGLTVYPSTANFVLVKVADGWGGRDLRNHLITRHGVFVRECGNKLGMTSDFLRLVVRPAADVERLMDGLWDYASGRPVTMAA